MSVLRLSLVAALLAAPAGAALAAPQRAIIVRDADVATPGPPPHEGLGKSVGFPLGKTAHLEKLFFAKRSLSPGATIGRHPFDHEEVYYVVSGRGLVVDALGSRPIGPASALVMHPGDEIELRQQGAAPLVFIVAGVNP